MNITYILKITTLNAKKFLHEILFLKQKILPKSLATLGIFIVK